MNTAQKIVKKFSKESWQTKMGAVELAYMEELITSAEHTTLTQWYMADKAQVQALEEAILFDEVFA